MSGIDKFYEDIFSNIKKLEKEKKFDEAIKILEDELQTQYIPINFQTLFEEKLIQIKFDKNYNNDKNILDNINKNDFLKKILENENISEIIYFFEKFKDNLNEDDKLSLYKLLQNKKIGNNKKILILENLKKIDLNKDFIFYNSNLDKEFRLNIKNIKFIESIDFFLNSRDFILKIIDKEPTIIELSYTIIYSYYEYYFPSFDFEYSYNEFIYAIINVIENLLKGSKIKKNNATNDVLNVVKSIK